MTKEQSDSVDMLRQRGFEIRNFEQGCATLCKLGIKSALYAVVSPSGKVNGDSLKTFLKRFKHWTRKQDRKALKP